MSPRCSASKMWLPDLTLQDRDARWKVVFFFYPPLLYPGCLSLDKSLNHCQPQFMQLSDRIYVNLTSRVAGKNKGELYKMSDMEQAPSNVCHHWFLHSYVQCLTRSALLCRASQELASSQQHSPLAPTYCVHFSKQNGQLPLKDVGDK